MVMQLFVRKGRKIRGAQFAGHLVTNDQTRFQILDGEFGKHSSLSRNALKLKRTCEYKMSTMSNFVDISFDCLPLRSVPRFDVPLDDAAPEAVEFAKRVRRAVTKHGQFNTYYLYDAQCVFHLTNDEKIGMVGFRFEGTVLTDGDDLKTLDCDLEIELAGEVCDWLTADAVAWLKETVGHAVRVEFDRYIHAGDLQRTIERLEKLRAESDAQGGFLGMGL